GVVITTRICLIEAVQVVLQVDPSCPRPSERRRGPARSALRGFRASRHSSFPSTTRTRRTPPDTGAYPSAPSYWSVACSSARVESLPGSAARPRVSLRPKSYPCPPRGGTAPPG